MIEFTKHKIHNKIQVALGNLESFSKCLQLMSIGENKSGKKLVLSDTIITSIVGWAIGGKYTTEVTQGQGFILRGSQPGDTNLRTVSYRNYKARNTTEAVVDIRHQSELSKGFGSVSHAHIVYKRNEIHIKPVHRATDKLQHNTSGAIFKILGKDEDGLFSGILEAVSLVKKEKFQSITIDGEQGFNESTECQLLTIQLRRIGYEISFGEGNQIFAKLSKREVIKTSTYVFKPILGSSVDIKPDAITFNKENTLSSFTICTSGVDIAAMEQDEWSSPMMLDWRPHEERDFKKSKCKTSGLPIRKLTDKSDTGAFSAIINSKTLKHCFNEDFYKFELNRVRHVYQECNLMHVSILCDDFSLLKTNALKMASILKLDTTVDMFFCVLDQFKATNIPTLLVENVKGFLGSVSEKLLTKGLKQLGCNVQSKILNAAKDYNGMSNRERCYLFASKLQTPFYFPEPVKKTSNAWHDVIKHNLDSFRMVSHCKSVIKGVETGRIRLMKEGSAHTPCWTKSQNRQTKDSCYLFLNGDYYMPDYKTIMKLMGFPKDFDLTCFSSEIATEICGQSIEIPMHKLVMKSVKEHIESFVNGVEQIKDLAKVSVNEIHEKFDKTIQRKPLVKEDQLGFSF